MRRVPGPSARDGSPTVHLTSTGQAEFALWLRQAVVDGAISSAGRLAPPKRIEVQVSGRTVTLPDGTTTTIPADVTTASFNVVAVTPTAGGFVTVWPCSAPRPVASSLNYSPGAIDGNGVIAPVDTNGKACMYSHATTDLVVDISGWFGPRDGNGSGLTAVTPSRVVDSRVGVGVPLGRVRPEAPATVQVVGAGVQLLDGSSAVIPADAVAAAINVTAVNPEAAGYVTVWPCGVPRPLVSTLSFGAGAISRQRIDRPTRCRRHTLCVRPCADRCRDRRRRVVHGGVQPGEFGVRVGDSGALGRHP